MLSVDRIAKQLPQIEHSLNELSAAFEDTHSPQGEIGDL